MNGVGTKMPGFCMSQHATVRIRVRSPSQQHKRSYSSSGADYDDKTDQFSSKNSNELNFNMSRLPESECGNNRVMVVVDSSFEAKGALQWTLSHTVQSQDTIVLLHVTKPYKQGGNSNRELNQKAYELLCSMKEFCQVRRPGVEVEMALRDGKEKGPMILEEAKQQKVSVLVLGQRKRSLMWRLHMMIWASKKIWNSSSVADYCIQNANCVAIAVRRKSRKYGGYLITTKRHKDFWHLA